MADKLIAVPEQHLTDIADAIRLKRDIVTPIPVSDMPMEIGLIESGGSGGLLELLLEHQFSIADDYSSSTTQEVIAIPFDPPTPQTQYLTVIDLIKKTGNLQTGYGTKTYGISAYRDSIFNGRTTESAPMCINDNRNSANGYTGVFFCGWRDRTVYVNRRALTADFFPVAGDYRLRVFKFKGE